jgi:hypothetical protein
MTKFQHGTWVSFVLVGVVGHIAVSMENNDSRLLGVKKQEFKRVILEIFQGGQQSNEQTTREEEQNEELEPVDMVREVITSPRSLATQAAQGKKTNGTSKLKNDSFYYLQKSIEDREARLRRASAPGSSTVTSNSSSTYLRSRNSRKSSRLATRTIGEEDLLFHDSYSDNDSIAEKVMFSKAF